MISNYVLNQSEISEVGPPGTLGKDRAKHLSQKSISLFTPLIMRHTQPGDIVVDPFAGSGACGVAAINKGRRFIGCEKVNDASGELGSWTGLSV